MPRPTAQLQGCDCLLAVNYDVAADILACLGMQAGVPPGTPTVDTLVSLDARWQCITAPLSYRPFYLLTSLSCLC